MFVQPGSLACFPGDGAPHLSEAAAYPLPGRALANMLSESHSWTQMEEVGPKLTLWKDFISI